jgi:hypothetical protein
MPGLVPGIHVLLSCGWKTWMAGTSPAMTSGNSGANFFIQSECKLAFFLDFEYQIVLKSNFR